MSNLDAAQQAFIRDTLVEFREYWLKGAKERLISRNIEVNEDLLQSLAAETTDTELKLYFADHGRMHDMGAGRGYSKGKFLGPEERGDLLKGRKPSMWYTRFTWGSIYGRLLEDLQNKYIANVPGHLVAAFREAANG